MCYSYRDQEAREEARRMVREKEERRRREERAKGTTRGPVPAKERELVKA